LYKELSSRDKGSLRDSKMLLAINWLYDDMRILEFRVEREVVGFMPFV